MVTSQSRAPEPVLSQWQELGLPFDREPILIASLSGGTTNHNYLIDVAGERLVLRLNDPHSSLLGIDREREAVILTAASDAGLTPQVIYCSPEHGLLISEFVAGRHWRGGDLAAGGRREQLRELLEAVHGLAIDLPDFNYVEHVDRYWRQLTAAGRVTDDKAELEHQVMLSKAAQLQSVSVERRLCHHDPLPANVLESRGRLYLLDWEYAGLGNPLFDFAAVSVEWQVSGEELGVDEEQQTQHRLAMQVYRYVCALWRLLRR